MGKKITIVGAVTLVAVAAIAGYFLVNGGKDTVQQTTQSPTVTTQSTATKDITVIIADTSSLSTLATALQAAALDQTLEDVGPYTVIAPTNQAFEDLPDGTLATLSKPENAKQLERILGYHVIPGKLLTSQLADGQKLKTVNGQELVVDMVDGAVVFIDAKGNKAVVEKANIEATNGVVHIVNAVVLPQ